MKSPLKIFIVIVVLSFSVAASGASLIISSSGNGVFTLQGAGLNDVAGIDATISYDTSTLSGPRVVQGGLISGAMMAANPNVPGIIRIAAVKAGLINGSGVIATINFNTAAGSSGKILSLSARVINGSGAQLGVQTQVLNPASSTGSPDTATASQTVSDTVAANTSGSLGQRYLGPTGASLPSESGETASRKATDLNTDQPARQSSETRSAETAAETVPEMEKPAVSSSAPSAEGKTVIYKSVLDFFREYTGKRTLRAFKALFDKAAMPGIRQEPAVALSDGKTRVKVFIQIPASRKEAPNFALKGAKLISLKLEGSTWVIEAMPDGKAYDAGITVLNNGSLTQIPLAVAPPVDVKTERMIISDEAGFALFLKERGAEKAPRFDLNNDGKRDYIDDFIFIANYIVKQGSTVNRIKEVKR